jgi:dTDP-4-dehydrorhamnose 3,5-epimerase
MQIERLEIPEVVLTTPKFWRDDRGFFVETYRKDLFTAAGIDIVFVQDNHAASSARGTLRGLHFQLPPRAQDKLVRCTRGAILDVAVDIRAGSPTFGRHVAVRLSAADGRQLLVPKGFAHGYCTLEPDTEVVYKVSDYYAPECDRGLAWDDPALAIDWGITAADVVLSPKDRVLPRLADLPPAFGWPG